jgi:hypothetical protein
MRDLLKYEINKFRRIDKEVYDRYGEFGDNTMGVFEIPYKTDTLRVIASSGEGWDHVSVSMKNRIPNWYEMEYIAKLFFNDNEVAIQYHVPRKEHINIMENCLHWWRPHSPTEIPMPPPIFV